MNVKYTDDYLLNSAREFTLMAEWRRAKPSHYQAAFKHGLLPKIGKFLILQTTGAKPAYSETFLIKDAKAFPNKPAWEAAGKAYHARGEVSPFICATKRGQEFMDRACAHMQELRHYWTDEELIEIASYYQHKGDWRHSDDAGHRNAYASALRRPDTFSKACAHMTPKANPGLDGYTIYAYEFSDRHAYVGLTCVPEDRHFRHKVKGPVFKHMRVCPVYILKVVATNVFYTEAGAEEGRWMDRYEQAGWLMLNSAPAGSLGAVGFVTCNMRQVVERARKYTTRTAWIRGDQYGYKIALREGWLDEATAHMPRRVLGVGTGIKRSPEAREKMRQAKLGTKQTPEHRAAISAALTGRLRSPEERAAISAGRRGMVFTPEHCQHIADAARKKI